MSQKPEILENADKSKRATIYADGYVVRRVFYTTGFGPNSSGWEIKYPNVETARQESIQWVNQ